ncbi:hypothetical protein [Nocardioides flavescens]|uniref:DUF4439 domain-containing protein n=1 Tax=Nocardioides flavescens TaxID=2691959 RepID=A0A6L7EQY4_9ACTN|nr:hypothetical protein [Nocardioides flavescens]MXG87996.1 hypothetical protein [Nocardioides flavescens]
MPDRPLLSRRTSLALPGLVALGATAACDVDDLRPPQDDPTPSAAASASPTGAPGGDTAVVEEVVAALDAVLAQLLAARSVPAQRAAVVPLLRAHRRHVEALDATSRATPSPTPVSVEQVRAQELALRGSLVDSAGRAESGALARLLASMAASVDQHLAVLPTGGAR